MFCWFCNIFISIWWKVSLSPVKILHDDRNRQRTVLNRKHNYLKISKEGFIKNFLCKALWKAVFYSALLTTYTQTSKNAPKQALHHLLTGERLGNFSAMFSPQLRAQYAILRKEWFNSDILNWVGKQGFFVFISKRWQKWIIQTEKKLEKWGFWTPLKSL